jgi:ABC-type uncharacterized transport system auxiliary subunit
LGVVLWLAGCFGGAAPPPRYFHPVMTARAPVAAVDSGARSLRVRAVQAAAHLDDRIVWRRTEAEVGYYGDERWTEAPPAYVEEALGRELFERRGLRRSASTAAPCALEVVVRRFEEVLLPDHLARVELTVSLTDLERTSLLERTFRVERPVSESSAEAMAAAMGQALQAAVEQVADAVEGALPLSQGS